MMKWKMWKTKTCVTTMTSSSSSWTKNNLPFQSKVEAKGSKRSGGDHSSSLQKEKKRTGRQSSKLRPVSILTGDSKTEKKTTTMTKATIDEEEDV